MNTTTEKNKNSKSGKVGNIIVDVILVLAIAFFAVVGYSAFTAQTGESVPNFLGLNMSKVLTNSMEPEFSAGDMIFSRTVKDASKLKVGDVISFWTVINGEKVINTHRIVEVLDGGTFRSFTTKGDANPVNDTLTVHENSVIGKYSFHISGLGTAFDYLQTSQGFLIVIVIPVAVFFLWQLIQFFRALFAYQAEKVKLAYAAEHGIRVPTEDEEGSGKSGSEQKNAVADGDGNPGKDTEKTD